jgi:DNA-binding transcriptional ArsR family regulator
MAQVRKSPLPLAPVECCRVAESAWRPEFFRALADPTRLSLLFRLAELGGEATVGRVAGCCPVDLSGVSRHLAALRSAGLLAAERAGQEVRYRIQWTEIVKTLRDLADSLEACCPAPTSASQPQENLHDDRRQDP